MKSLKEKLIAGLSGAVLLSGLALASDDDSDVDASQAAIALPQAIEIALSAVPGQVTESELEEEDGRLVWEIELTGDDQQNYEVEIDAMTGEILEKEIEND